MSKNKSYRQREAARRAEAGGYGVTARRDKAVKVVALLVLLTLVVSILPIALGSI